MTIKFLLDSNIISEPSRPQPNTNVLNKLSLYRGEVAVGSIVVHEILYGCLRLPQSKRRDYLWGYIQESVLNLPIFDYDLKSAQYHAQERARLSKMGKTPAFADGQIAAIAFCNDLVVVTNNVSDFEDFNGLKVENWFIGEDGD